MKKAIRSSTKSCYLDSNILVYLKDISSPHYQKTIKLLQKLEAEKYNIFISPLCLDEFLYINYRYFKKLKAKNFYNQMEALLSSILEIPGIRLLNPPKEREKQIEVIKLMGKFKLAPRDAYHLFIIRENNLKFMATFDQDFNEVFKKSSLNRFE